MRRIQLSQGQVTKVDNSDFDALSRHGWYARWNSSTQSYYAVRNSRKNKSGRRHQVQMARVILGLRFRDPRKADHALHDTLDNRRIVKGRINLRVANAAQNAQNRKRQANNTSGETGVDQHKGKWRARIRSGPKLIDLGYFPTKGSARRARRLKALELHGKFANF